MTPEEYCSHKAAPAGSNLYYSGLYHDPQSRRRLYALFAFHHELNEVLYGSSDPGAARVTLSWWFEESNRLFSGTARHPVTQELSQLKVADYLSQQQLAGYIMAQAQFLDTPESNSCQDWLARHDAIAGYIWQVAARSCGCTDQDKLSVLVRAGSCYGAFEQLHHIKRLNGLGLNVLPTELLLQHGLAPDAIGHTGSRTDGFFSDLLGRLHDDAQTCLAALQQNSAGNLLFALSLLKMLGILCRSHQTADLPITHARISLLPIRKLWIAWKTARVPRQPVRAPSRQSERRLK